MKTFWLSLADEDDLATSRVVLVDAESAQEASDAALLWAQPGAEVLTLEIPPEEPEYALPRNRVLTLAEIEGVGALRIDEAREQGLIPVWEEPE